MGVSVGKRPRIPRRSRVPVESPLVRTRKVENGKARRDTGTLPVRSTNENLRGTFVFHAGHVDTFLPLGRNGTRRTTGQASATRQSLSPHFRNKRFSQLTRDIPVQYSLVLFGNLYVLIVRVEINSSDSRATTPCNIETIVSSVNLNTDNLMISFILCFNYLYYNYSLN